MPLDSQAKGAIYFWLVIVPIGGVILLSIVLYIFHRMGWL